MITKRLGLAALMAAALALVACGGGGASIDSACDHVCQCAVEAGSIPADQKAACVNGCKAEAAMEMPSDECVDCVEGASCSALNAGTACAAECETSDAGVAPKPSFWRRR